MVFIDLIKETLWSLTNNKARSSLTILGIIIGIASVITMVAIGQGAQNSIAARIESIGSNLILVMPGAQRIGGINQGGGSSQSLTLEDAAAIKSQLTDVKAVAPAITSRKQATAGGNNTNTQIIGTNLDYLIARNVSIDTGSFFTDQNISSSAKVAVIGPTVRDDLFGAGTNFNPVGQSIRINNVQFQIIGMTESKGGTGFANQDDVIFIPITSAEHYIVGQTTYVNNISVAAADQSSITTVQNEVNDLLLARHKISDPTQADFSLLNQSDIIATASSVTGTFTTLLASIAGISLLVGGIGIMNMMLTTVTERTREIGLRKAVGIRKIYVNMQFLVEAIVLTFIGGIFGIFLGWIASYLVTHFVSTLVTSISLNSIFLAFGVSTAIGIIFGFYPARKASNLNPIDALRYE
jgi:putative ABC transport system permease protein